MTANQHFNEFFKSLPEKDRISLREAFLQRSGMSFPTFYGKLCGRSTWKPLEKECLANLAGVPIEEMFGTKLAD